MRIRNIISAAVILVSSLVFFGFKQFQGCDPIDRKQLRDMLVQLGYTVKDIGTEVGKEKYEMKLTRDGLDIPIGAEISPSGNYIWLTVFLGASSPDNGSKNLGLLQQNGVLQPCQFYITAKGNLMMGLPVENRGVDNALLRTKMEFIAGKVGGSKTYWQ